MTDLKTCRYKNEEFVGKALRDSGVPRKEYVPFTTILHCAPTLRLAV